MIFARRATVILHQLTINIVTCNQTRIDLADSNSTKGEISPREFKVHRKTHIPIYTFYTAGSIGTDKRNIVKHCISLFQIFYAYSSKGRVYLWLATCKGKVGLRGKGDREGALPLLFLTQTNLRAFDWNVG